VTFAIAVYIATLLPVWLPSFAVERGAARFEYDTHAATQITLLLLTASVAVR